MVVLLILDKLLNIEKKNTREIGTSYGTLQTIHHICIDKKDLSKPHFYYQLNISAETLYTVKPPLKINNNITLMWF
jgi:hypothetical protein